MKCPILIVHSGLNWIRGSERVVIDLVKNLDATRFPPFVLCNTPTLYNAIKKVGVPVEIREFPVAKQELREIVTARNIRIVHSACASPVRWLLRVTDSEGIPLIAHLQTVYSRQLRYSERLHGATIVVGVSEAAIEGLHADGMPSSRLRVVYNGIDPKRLITGDATTLRAELGIEQADVVYVFAGALTAEKSVSTLLDAMRFLPNESRLILVGDGPERDRLESIARRLSLSNRTHFLGMRSDVGAIFRDAADICVLSSVQEGFPLVLLEAAYCGVPSVATDVGGVREAIRNGLTGIVVPPRDPVALSNALLRLTKDPDERCAMGQAAKKYAEANFLIDGMVRSFENIYSELISVPASSNTRRRLWTIRTYLEEMKGDAIQLLRRWSETPK